MDISHFLFLTCVGVFTIAQAQDCFKPVPGENMGLRDEDIAKESFPSGTKVRLTCNVGYRPAGGSPSITCTAGSWSSVTLRCERKTCGALEALLNGDINYDGNEFGDSARYVCNTGYSLVGRDICHCEDQGWDCRPPRCEVVTCDPPPATEGGTYNPVKEAYNYREVIEYFCTGDLALIGSRTISCSEVGQFNPSPPQCKDVECPDPQVANGQWDAGSRPPHRYQATLTFKCNSGYKLKGQATIKCGSDNRWSPEPPLCEAAPIDENCERPPEVDNGFFSPDKNVYQLNEEIKYSCSSGYELSGSATQSCSLSGTFEPAPPTCIKDSYTVQIIIGVVVGAAGVAVIIFIVVYIRKKKNSSLKVHDGQKKTKGQKGTEDEAGVILPERKNGADAERND